MDRRHVPIDESILEAALDHINHGVVIYDQDLFVVRINSRAREILHVTSDMFALGEPFEKLAWLNASRGGYGGVGTVEERVAMRMAKARTFAPFQEDQHIFDGTIVEVFGHPVPGGGYAITYTDITRRIEAEAELANARDELERRVDSRTAELRESEAQLRLVTDNVPALIAYVDRDLVIRFANRPYAEDFGVPQDDIVGMHVVDLDGGERLKSMSPYIASAFAGEVSSNERQWTNRNGETRYLRTTRVPHFGDGDAVQGYFLIHIDLTEHHQRAERLRLAHRMEAVGQLTGGVAHDFNNLLMVIMGNLELISDQVREGDGRTQVATAIRAVERGADLTERLLAFSRMQTLTPRVVEPAPLLVGMADVLRRTLGETIEVAVAATIDPWPCNVDASRLETAILNLAINASHAMPDGGMLTIAAENAVVTPGEWVDRWEGRPGEYVAVKVTDSGAGMSAEVLDHAFEPFFTTKEVGAGSGLGLSMVYGFAQQSDGFATIESAVDKGTTVAIYLPRARPGGAAAAPPNAEVELRKGRGERILLIEDDGDVRDGITSMLEALDYVVLAAEDGPSALATLPLAGPIDLVLSDVTLPGGMSGIDVYREIRAQRPEVRCLFMSSHAGLSEDSLPEGTELLGKPFALRDIAERLGRALKT